MSQNNQIVVEVKFEVKKDIGYVMKNTIIGFQLKINFILCSFVDCFLDLLFGL